MKHRSSVRG